MAYGDSCDMALHAVLRKDCWSLGKWRHFLPIIQFYCVVWHRPSFLNPSKAAGRNFGSSEEYSRLRSTDPSHLMSDMKKKLPFLAIKFEKVLYSNQFGLRSKNHINSI